MANTSGLLQGEEESDLCKSLTFQSLEDTNEDSALRYGIFVLSQYTYKIYSSLHLQCVFGIHAVYC